MTAAESETVQFVRYIGDDFPDPLVPLALALWNNLYDMTAFNKADFPGEPSLEHFLPYGDWETRSDKGEALLVAFYRVYFGEQGEQTARYFFALRHQCLPLGWTYVSGEFPPEAVALVARFEEAHIALDNLLGGVRVTGRMIEVPEGHKALAAS